MLEHWIRRLAVALLACAPVAVLAATEDDLLPVEQAFALTVGTPTRDRVELGWKIADGYYLYRSRIKTKTATPGVTLVPVETPDGEKKHDEFLGDVEVYHHGVRATQTYTITDPALTEIELAVQVQGCHQEEPKICYPPSTTKVKLTLPAAAAGTDPAPAAGGGLKAALGQLSGKSDAPVAQDGVEVLPLPPEQAFRFETIATSPGELLARWTMPKGYYLYRDKTKLTLANGAGVTLGAPRWPPGVPHKDEHFGDVTVYFDQVELPIPLTRTGTAAQKITLDAEFQGCQDGGVCYPLMTRHVDVELPAGTATAPAAVAPAAAGAADDTSEEQRLAASLKGNRLVTLLSFFGFGLLLAFTPCVFPMIPILSGIIAGAGDISTRRAFVLSLVYVLASTLVFTLAGVAAGLLGANLQAAFQKPWILWSFAGLFALLSLSMFGFYDLQLPSSWQARIANVSNRQSGGSLVGVAIMGLLSSLIVGPCVAPPLAGAVLYISQEKDPFFGGLALCLLSLGMGAPLVVAGTAAGQLLPRAGAWMDKVKAVFGVSFLLLGIWMLSRILDPVWIMTMIGVLAIACAVYLGALERVPEGASGWSSLWKALGVVLLLFGALELIGAAAGSRDLTQPLKGLSAHGGGGAPAAEGAAFRTIKSVADLDAALAAADRPVLLDFYADWCVSCKEMEKFTFSKPEVQQAFAGFLLLKADVTANDETDQALLKRFSLIGPPATIFFGRDHAERRGQRLIGFEEADKFLSRLRKTGT